jgi:hypothetical protein
VRTNIYNNSPKLGRGFIKTMIDNCYAPPEDGAQVGGGGVLEPKTQINTLSVLLTACVISWHDTTQNLQHHLRMMRQVCVACSSIDVARRDRDGRDSNAVVRIS